MSSTAFPFYNLTQRKKIMLMIILILLKRKYL